VKTATLIAAPPLVVLWAARFGESAAMLGISAAFVLAYILFFRFMVRP
jgi:hypothetical protein